MVVGRFCQAHRETHDSVFRGNLPLKRMPLGHGSGKSLKPLATACQRPFLLTQVVT
jgi:hypothetical protein